MKINNAIQRITQEDKIKKNDQIEKTQKNTTPSKTTQKPEETNGIKASFNAQQIKKNNTDIGKLQVIQKSLNAIDSDVKKLTKLFEKHESSLDITEQSVIDNKMSVLKKNIESILKQANFEEINVFSKDIKDNNGQVIFDVKKLNINLLNTDVQKFYQILKEQQAQTKEAIQILQTQAQESADKLSHNDISHEDDMKNTDTSFLKKLGSLFRTSHNTDKLDSQRVQKLLM